MDNSQSQVSDKQPIESEQEGNSQEGEEEQTEPVETSIKDDVEHVPHTDHDEATKKSLSQAQYSDNSASEETPSNDREADGIENHDITQLKEAHESQAIESKKSETPD